MLGVGRVVRKGGFVSDVMPHLLANFVGKRRRVRRERPVTVNPVLACPKVQSTLVFENETNHL
jgi:hypothetical protein